jgi:putative transposase
MAAELTEHDMAGNNSGNSRNGKSAKTIMGTFGEIALETPRDRNGTFEPQIIKKTSDALHRLRFQYHFAVCARAFDPRDPTAPRRIYQVEVSPGLVSIVTEAVLDEVKTWQNRQLDAVYPIMNK